MVAYVYQANQYVLGLVGCSQSTADAGWITDSGEPAYLPPASHSVLAARGGAQGWRLGCHRWPDQPHTGTPRPTPTLSAETAEIHTSRYHTPCHIDSCGLLLGFNQLFLALCMLCHHPLVPPFCCNLVAQRVGSDHVCAVSNQHISSLRRE